MSIFFRFIIFVLPESSDQKAYLLYQLLLLAINGTDLLSAPVSLLLSIAWISQGFSFQYFVNSSFQRSTLRQSIKAQRSDPHDHKVDTVPAHGTKAKMSIEQTLWAQDFLNRTTKLLFCLSGAEKSDLAWPHMRVLAIGQSRWETTKTHDIQSILVLFRIGRQGMMLSWLCVRRYQTSGIPSLKKLQSPLHHITLKRKTLKETHEKGYSRLAWLTKPSGIPHQSLHTPSLCHGSKEQLQVPSRGERGKRSAEETTKYRSAKKPTENLDKSTLSTTGVPEQSAQQSTDTTDSDTTVWSKFILYPAWGLKIAHEEMGKRMKQHGE